ncbi:MAG: hypothetical protein F6K31_11795 [Symploca sp. SIO2G7]|nr:hypothetical protein [Symploca sp. SIO2G7]
MMELWIIDWLSAKSEREAAEIWQKAHPDKNIIYYTFCPEIKAFWKSPMGRFVRHSSMFWSHVKRWIKQPRNQARFLWWRLKWKRKSLGSRVRRVL